MKRKIMESFIEEIKNYKELYDKKSEFYHDTKRKNKIWEEIGKKFNVDAKTKWTRIRDRYVREKKKMEQPSGSAADNSSQWELFPYLQFLDDCIKPKRLLENIYVETTDTDIAESPSSVDIFSPCSEGFESDVQANTSTDIRRTKKSKKRNVEKNVDEEILGVIDIIKESVRKSVETSSSNKYSDEDEDEWFLKSIACKMAKMTPEAKLEFKIKMLRESESFVNE